MEKSYTLREMLEALRRRRWLALGVTVAVLLVGGIVIASTPDEYRADSVMQIEPHQMPHDFFPTSFVSFDERMRTLKHGVLARPVLERVLRETEYYPDWKSNPDDALEKLRRNVEVRLEGEVAGGPPSLLFVVEVRGYDAGLVGLLGSAKAFGRFVQSSAEASAETPSDSEVVTAISSGAAPTRSAKLPRAFSAWPTQYSHGAPSSSQSRR